MSEKFYISALQTILEAGRGILKIYNHGEYNTQNKKDGSPLTLADKVSHSIIFQNLGTSGLPILSEEGLHAAFLERRSWTEYWLVDPLDGTKEFIKRNGEFTVNIALVRKVQDRFIPVFGVVYIPVKDVLYLGVHRFGAWKIERAATKEYSSFEDVEAYGKKLPFSSGEQKRPLTVVVSRSHNNQETEELVAELEKRYGKIQRLTSGSSIKMCLVAEGLADIYPRFGPTMEWDTAAGDAVCRAAECEVTRRDGVRPLTYNKEDLHNPPFLVVRRDFPKDALVGF